TTVAEARKVLRREEREGGRVAEGARPAAVYRSPDGLRRVLDDRDAQLAQVGDGRDVAEQVDGDDRPGVLRHRALDGLAGDPERRRIDVAEDGHRTRCDDRLGGSAEG